MGAGSSWGVEVWIDSDRCLPSGSGVAATSAGGADADASATSGCAVDWSATGGVGFSSTCGAAGAGGGAGAGAGEEVAEESTEDPLTLVREESRDPARACAIGSASESMRAGVEGREPKNDELRRIAVPMRVRIDFFMAYR